MIFSHQITAHKKVNKMIRNNLKIFMGIWLILLSACSQATKSPAPTTIAQASTPTVTLIPATSTPTSTSTHTPLPTSTPTPKLPTPTPTDTSTPTNTPMPTLDPSRVFVEYYTNNEDGTIWQLDGDTVKKILDFRTEELTVGNWNKELTGWEIVGGKRKGETLFSDGSISETASSTTSTIEGCKGADVGFFSRGFCEYNPDQTETILTAEGDVFSVDLTSGKKINWSKNGFFHDDNMPMFVGWLDKDHILLSTNWDFDLTTFVLGRDGTLTEVSKLNGFGISRDVAILKLNDDAGYIRHFLKKEDGLYKIVRPYPDKPWEVIFQDTCLVERGYDRCTDVRYYAKSNDEFHILLTPTGFLFVGQQTDEIKNLKVPSELSLWDEAFRLWDHSGDTFSANSLQLKFQDDGNYLLAYDGDAGDAEDNKWGGMWLVNFDTQQVKQLNNHFVQKVFWLDKDTILFTVNYTIDNVPAADLGTLLQKIGSEPVKIDTYRATSATMIPDTKEVLFVAKGILYKYDGKTVNTLTKEGQFYDGTFVWPQRP